MRKECDREAEQDLRRAQYEISDRNGRLIINFRDINRAMRALYEGKESQKRILIVLLETGKITQRVLTRRLGIQPGSASEVLAKLENAGLIVRKVSDEDRRTTDVSLTDEGRKQALEAQALRQERHEQMFSCLSEKEKEELLFLLEKINSDWKKRYGEMVEKKFAKREAEIRREDREDAGSACRSHTEPCGRKETGQKEGSGLCGNISENI